MLFQANGCSWSYGEGYVILFNSRILSWGEFKQVSFLHERIAFVIQADEVQRPANPEWATLSPKISESHGFLILPGEKGILQFRTPCLQCPTCRTFDFSKYKDCTNGYRGPARHSEFISVKEKIEKRLEHDNSTREIKRHLIAARWENFAKKDPEKYKVSAATVQRSVIFAPQYINLFKFWSKFGENRWYGKSHEIMFLAVFSHGSPWCFFIAKSFRE